MKVFLAGGTGAIGRPIAEELRRRGHTIVALTRSEEKAQVLVEQGIEPAIADVFDPEGVRTVLESAPPDVVIENLTALPKRRWPPSRPRSAATQGPT